MRSAPLGYSPRAWRVFGWLFGPRMRLGVRALRMAGLPRDLREDRPVLLASNHTSWWDGFLLRPLQVALRPRDRFQVVMLERELARRPLLRLLGGIGLEPGSASSLRRLLRLLEGAKIEDPRLTVLFFPQGRIWPTWRRPLGFQGGVRLVAQALAPVTVLPVGLHLEAGRYPAATAYLSVGAPLAVEGGELDTRHLEERVQTELDRIHAVLADWGEDADSRWPRPFEPLPNPTPSAGHPS